MTLVCPIVVLQSTSASAYPAWAKEGVHAPCMAVTKKFSMTLLARSFQDDMCRAKQGAGEG